MVYDEHGKTIFKIEHELEEWKKYITNVFAVDILPSDITQCSGPLITCAVEVGAIQ